MPYLLPWHFICLFHHHFVFPINLSKKERPKYYTKKQHYRWLRVWFKIQARMNGSNLARKGRIMELNWRHWHKTHSFISTYHPICIRLYICLYVCISTYNLRMIILYTRSAIADKQFTCRYLSMFHIASTSQRLRFLLYIFKWNPGKMTKHILYFQVTMSVPETAS